MESNRDIWPESTCKLGSPTYMVEVAVGVEDHDWTQPARDYAVGNPSSIAMHIPNSEF
jgi:hypothetical protein